MLNLGRLEHRVDRRKYTTSKVGGEESDDPLNAFIQVDADTFSGSQSQRNQTLGGTVQLFRRGSLVEHFIAADQGAIGAVRAGAFENKVLK
jgi:hypothetical protein